MDILSNIEATVKNIFGTKGAKPAPEIITLDSDDNSDEIKDSGEMQLEIVTNEDAVSGMNMQPVEPEIATTTVVPVISSDNKIAVTTRSYNNFRTGANINEKILTSLAIQKNGIKHLFDCMLPGDERGTEGMPLLVPDLTMEDGDVHDVLFVCTMSNDIWAFDANNPDPETGQGKLLWKQHVGTPVTNNIKIDMYSINDHWGIISTPVIDLATNTLYCVSLTSETGLIADGNYFLHALDLISGTSKAPALNVSNAIYQPPNGLAEIKHNASPRKQRTGLLLGTKNGITTVFFADSTFAMMSNIAHGFVIACDVTNVQKGVTELAATWTVTSRYAGAGIWMGSGGMIMDDDGYIYAFTANGAFDGITDFGNSFIKLQFTPKINNSPAALTIVDWWAGYTDSGRTGKDPTTPWIGLNGNYSGQIDGMDMTAPDDQDLGSAAPCIISKSLSGFTCDIILGAGKDGVLYMHDTANLGKTALEDFAPDKIESNYAKLLFPPYGLTYYNGDFNIAPTDLGTFSTTYGGFTHHQHCTPVVWKSPDHGILLFAGGENGPVRVVAISQNTDGNFEVNFVGEGVDNAGYQVTTPPGSMPGTFCTLSADGEGTNTGVLWCSQPLGDANKSISDGRLLIYGANWFDNTTLIKIWDSTDWNIQYKHNKFDIPMVANGKMYLPSYDGRILVFGLA